MSATECASIRARLAEALQSVADLTIKLADAEREAALATNRRVACCYCAWEQVSPETLMARFELLRAHVLVCPAHPMRAVEAQLAAIAKATGGGK